MLFTNSNSFVNVCEDMVAMSDGVRLYTRYATPKNAQKCPTVYIRTPYEPSFEGKPYDISKYESNKFVRTFIERGYAVLIQHCRGRGDSEGICIPYSKEERTDGLETIEYIRTLPFYNGEIYVTGESYVATVHFCYLDVAPSDIKGACLQIQTDRLYFRNYRNGLNYKLNNLGWWSKMAERKYKKISGAEPTTLPYIDAAKRLFGVDAPEFTNTLIHNECDEYWTSDDKWNAVENLTIPTLFVEGWYDFYIEGMTDMWARIPSETKKKSAMFIGPYGHATCVSNKSEYPLENGNIPEDYVAEWFDSIREKRSFKYAEYGKINYYSIGADEWRNKEYPTEAKKRRLYFSKDKKLSKDETKGGEFSYEYDPNIKETPYRFFDIYRAHAQDTKDGIISFFSNDFEEEQSFFGSVRFRLTVSSDCEDTAFFARIHLVENGESYNLTEALGSISHLHGDYTPNEKITVEFKTPLIAFTVKKGMGLRIDVTSNGGLYLPHANVKGHFAYVTETKVAHNTLYTDGSFVELPLEK